MTPPVTIPGAELMPGGGKPGLWKPKAPGSGENCGGPAGLKDGATGGADMAAPEIGGAKEGGGAGAGAGGGTGAGVGVAMGGGGVAEELSDSEGWGLGFRV